MVTRIGSSNMFSLEKGEYITNGVDRINGPQVVRVFEYPGNVIAVQGVINDSIDGKLEIDGTEDNFTELVKLD